MLDVTKNASTHYEEIVQGTDSMLVSPGLQVRDGSVTGGRPPVLPLVLPPPPQHDAPLRGQLATLGTRVKSQGITDNITLVFPPQPSAA